MVAERKYADDMREYTLENDLLKVNILEYGATIHNIFYPVENYIEGNTEYKNFLRLVSKNRGSLK